MWIWLVIAVLAAIGELLSYDLFLAPVATAAVIASGLALVLPLAVQMGAFAGLSLIGIVFLRPLLKHALGLDHLTIDAARSATSNIVGRHAVVTQTVDALGGQIRLGQGEFWTARSFDPSETLATGQVVDVVLVEGVAALVEPSLEPAPNSAIRWERPIERGIES